jgi:hypothetical protein
LAPGVLLGLIVPPVLDFHSAISMTMESLTEASI